jgi:VWFA-related protein
MKKTCLFLFIVIGIASIQSAENQIRRANAEAIPDPGVSKSLVLIDARVTDKNGAFVPGLQAEDFEIYQDGRIQEIAEFYPLSRTNSSDDQRTILFVIDNLGLSKAKFNQVRTALKYFADTVMTPSDMVGFMQTAGCGVVVQPFTSNAAEVRAAADRWQWSLAAAQPYEGMSMIFPSSSSSFIKSCSAST